MVARLKLARQAVIGLRWPDRPRQIKSSFIDVLSYLDFYFCFVLETVDNLLSRHHEAVGGFFGASHR